MIKRLEDELALSETAARWAVESWALVLGISVASVEPPWPALETPRPPVAPLASSSSPLKPFTVFRDQLRDGSDGPAMIAIPAGGFWMGSPENQVGRSDDECRHRVLIAQPFAIGQYTVIFDEYDRFCTAIARQKPEDRSWGRGNRPVINVNWYDAVEYAEWLSARTGQAYRLPTEAEWEYAARAGTETAFWWGDSITTDQANYDGNCAYRSGRKEMYREKTVSVDQFQPNPWGLYQVHGNVWEWTASCYDRNYDGTEMRFAGKNKSGTRVLRGGSWGYGPTAVRSATRYRAPPALGNNDRGFRIARSL